MSNLETSRAQRLDQRVVALIPELSRGFAVKLIETGKVTVNGTAQFKAGSKLIEADEVVVDYDTAQLADIPDIELPILYEDDDCVVISKPTGLLTHSKGAFNPEASVATWLRRHLVSGVWQAETDLAGNARAGIVHRLDRATSGVMICAKTPAALSWLQKQFAERKSKKTYVAVVQGVPKESHAIIDMPLERNPRKPQTFRVGANGKTAQTTYRVLQTDGQRSLLELTPQTGRTHQLRVHLAYIGHPILGDELYGGKPAERLYLHAQKLELTVPNRQRQVFEAAVPAVFAAAINEPVDD